MGCDIHLHVEYRLKKERVMVIREAEYDNDGNEVRKAVTWTEKTDWRKYQYSFEWSNRLYGMFAILADVRNNWGLEHIELRGFPDDATLFTKEEYYLRVITDDEFKKYGDNWHNCCSVSNALSWGGKRFIMDNYEYTEHPDWHSANWCTTEEMKNAIDTIFKNEDGTYKGDYIQWMGLLGTMQGIESSGEYECRAVYWFDN
jgi:hypothetical protein